MNDKEQTGLSFHFDSYPIVPVTFKYKQRKTPIIESLLDSGGDFIVLPMPIARFLKLDLEPACDVDTAGGTSSLYQTKIDMLIGKQNKCILYKNQEIHVSCQEDIPVLLGRNPIFDDHEITFKKQKNQLIINPTNHEIYTSPPIDF